MSIHSRHHINRCWKRLRRNFARWTSRQTSRYWKNGYWTGLLRNVFAQNDRNRYRPSPYWTNDLVSCEFCKTAYDIMTETILSTKWTDLSRNTLTPMTVKWVTHQQYLGAKCINWQNTCGWTYPSKLGTDLTRYRHGREQRYSFI